MQTVCDLPGRNIFSLGLEFGETEIIAELTEMIIDLQLNLNIGKGMNKEQCVLAAKFIYKEFKQITIEDLTLVFSNGIKGVYGPIFDRLDVAVICEWITKHLGLKNDFKYKGPDLGITPQQLSGLKKWQENKIIEPATASEIINAKGMPEETKKSLTAMFQRLGIKEPFKKDDKNNEAYIWPEPKDEFQTNCLDIFKEKWKEQHEPVLRSQNKPFIRFNEVMYNPDNWLTYCYKLSLIESNKLV